MRYTPNSRQERADMLDIIGVGSPEELYHDIPADIRLPSGLKMEDGLSEQELTRHMHKLSGQNMSSTSFLGAGYYRHHIPAAVKHIIGRSEFYTSYTPYQAEVSQGVLQALFEYQSMICELTRQDVANATMYDGSTALAEACVMAHNITGRDEIMASDTLHPQYRQVLKTYCDAGDLTLTVVDSEDGLSNNLKPSEDTATVVVQSPNFHGCIEDTVTLAKSAHETGTPLIGCVLEATSLGILAPPQADITCGEGQSLGNTLSYGGPAFGFLATSMKHVRRMPGRLVGETLDADGERGYVLTLQAREQHIRREKATSNICTAQSLCGIAACAHLALLGPEGLRAVALNSHLNAVYLSGKLSKLKGFSQVYKHPFYNEFLMRVPEGTYERIMDAGITPGLMVDDDTMLLCTTELHRKPDLDRLVEAVK